LQRRGEATSASIRRRRLMDSCCPCAWREKHKSVLASLLFVGNPLAFWGFGLDLPQALPIDPALPTQLPGHRAGGTLLPTWITLPQTRQLDLNPDERGPVEVVVFLQPGLASSVTRPTSPTSFALQRTRRSRPRAPARPTRRCRPMLAPCRPRGPNPGT